MTNSPGFFSKERITAAPGFNRWLVPPAALAVQVVYVKLCKLVNGK